MISAQAETAREARTKAEKEDDEEDKAEALVEAEKAKEREKELRIQAKKGMRKEGPRLRLDKAAGHPPRLCKDRKSSEAGSILPKVLWKGEKSRAATDEGRSVA